MLRVGLVQSARRFSTTAVKRSKYPKSADVVIVGGGVNALSTAYHLVKFGCKQVVVLERSKITSGTSWHTSGLIWGLRPSDTDIALLNRTKDMLVDELTKHEAIEDTGFINNGGLFLGHTEERLREYRRLHGMSKYWGIECRMVDRADIGQILGPLVVGEQTGLLGGLYVPSDGHVDPSMYCNALIKASAPQSKVYEDSVVEGINTQTLEFSIGGQERKVTGVQVRDTATNEVSEIQTNVVVSASGVWAPEVAKLAGILHVPQIALQHAYVVTEPIPGNFVNSKSVPNTRDHDLSLYFRPSGTALQVGGYESNPKDLDSKPSTLSPFSLFELDWDVFGVHMTNGIKLLPMLSSVGVKSTVCGPESFTPDHKPLLGEDAKVRGYYYDSGFNSLGMNLSGGCGQQLAKWILNGKPDLDMFAYDVRRFNPENVKSSKWVYDRSVEAYATNYSIVYPHDEPFAGRNETFKDPLYETLLEKNCVFEDRHGFERPGYFLNEPLDYREAVELDHSFAWNPKSKQWSAIEKECLACRQNVAVFNASYIGKTLITGNQATRALNWLVTSDMSVKEDGTATYTCVLNEAGGVEADLVVSKISDNNFYITSAGFAFNYFFNHIHDILKKEAYYKEVTINNVTKAIGVLSVQGPESRNLLTHALDLDLKELRFCQHKEITLKDHPDIQLRIIRITFVGELGYELHIPIQHLKTVYNLIMKSGQAIDAGWRAMDNLSLEKGYRHWHRDLRPDDSPYEAGLDHVVSSKKLESNNFFGAQMLRERKQKSTKQLLYLTLESSDVLPWGLEPILVNGQAVGYVRNSGFAYTLGKPVAVGYVDNVNQMSDLKDVQIVIDGKLYNAIVHSVSPFDPPNNRN